MSPRKEKLKWVQAISGAAGSGASNPTANAGAPVPAAKTVAAATSQKPKGKPAKGPKALSGESVMVLVDGLVYLGDRSFLEGTYKPDPVARSGDASVDEALRDAVGVIHLWNDPSNLSLAQKKWGSARKRLKALLTQVGQQGLDPAALKNARQAVDNITKHLGIRAAKVKAAKSAKPLPAESLTVLMDNLAYLANRSFLQGGYKPKPLASSGERSIDEALGQAAQTVTLWNDPATLPKAREYWREAESRLKALLTRAAQQGFDAARLSAARQASEDITKFLGIRLAQDKIAETEKGIETPDVNEAFDIRKLKETEKGLDPFRTHVQQIRRLAKEDSKLAKAAEAIELYYSVGEVKDKLAAFQKSEFKDKVKTVGDLVLFMTGVVRDTVEAHAKIAIKLAEKAGNKALAKQLEDKFKPLKTVTKILAFYEVYKSTVDLIDAIQNGDEKAIAAAGFNVATAVIGAAEAIGVVSAGGAAAGTGVLFIIWVEVDTILSVAQLHKWAREFRALQAVKRAIVDTKKIVPAGRKMAAAAQLLLEAQAAPVDVNQDGAGVAEIDAYEKQAAQLARGVAKDLKVLADKHFMRPDDKDSAGHYGLLMDQPAGRALSEAFMGIIPDNPLSVTQAFETIVMGIKSMATQGNKLYGDADPSGVLN